MKFIRGFVRSATFAFRRDKRANVAVIFAIAVIPLIGFVGASIDYSRAVTLRTKLQDALDSTALMLAKEAPNETSSVLQANAVKYFNALFNDSGAGNISITASYTTSGGSQVLVSGSGSVPTSFMKVLGYQNITIGGTSTTKWGSNRLRVALVLDNTGSMAESGKIAALQTATNNLLTQLQSAAGANGDVYVSIIPFVKDVNVGSGNYNSDWVYWGTTAQDPSQTDNASWDANYGSCSIGGYSPRSACVSHGTCSIAGYTSQSSCTAAGVCSNSGQTTKNSCTTTQDCSDPNYNKQNKCTNAGFTWDYGTWSTGVWAVGVWTPDSHSTWNGCVMDRGYPASPSNLSGNSGPDTANNYDTNVGSIDTSKPQSMYAAEQYAYCPNAAVMGLNYNWSTMTSLVNSMSPNGNTNQAIGLQLGWLSLVGGGPFSAPAKDPNYNYTQIIILLTDGLNTQNRWYTSQTSIDTRQATTCSNIKAAGITLYTIQVNTGGDPTSTLLQNCATDSAKFFLLTSSSQIVSTFQQIGTNLTQLRIAR
jgi:Flp pilus assembly protein TadG